jgi:hypothetical protein
VVGVEGQVGLQPEDQVRRSDADDGEDEQRDDVGAPALLALRVDAADPVDGALDGTPEAVSPDLLAGVEPGEVVAEYGLLMATRARRMATWSHPWMDIYSFSGLSRA